MPACIIPIGPEFEDLPNFPPVIVNADPPVGSVVTAPIDPTALQAFRVTLLDRNLADTLYVRWLVDYPPINSNSRLLEESSTPAPSSKVERDPVSLQPKCRFLPLGITQHQVLLAVSDRDWLPFSDAPATLPYTGVPASANVTFAAWTLNIECKEP